jgi:cytolysin-activating lysine-acyltransferase
MAGTPNGQAVAPPESAPEAGDAAAKASALLQELHLRLGQVAWLMLRSEMHKFAFLADLEWQVLPPLALRQARVFLKGPQPIAFASWGFVSAAVAERLRAGERRMQAADWRSGDQPWIVDLVTPFGARNEIVGELTEKVFGGKRPNLAGEAPAA